MTRKTRSPTAVVLPFAAPTQDSFTNFQAMVGHGTGNQNDGSRYVQTSLISQQRAQLDDAYRTSWIAGVAVDAVPDDATRMGITMAHPSDTGQSVLLAAEIERLLIWNAINECSKWGRLYGGCIGYIMLDGQAPETPLNLNAIAPGQFKGVFPIDRWSCMPSSERVTELGPQLGMPLFYDVMDDARALPGMRIHYTRAIRFGGVKLSYRQAMTTILWDDSILARVWDRLISFDSTTLGIAQLVYKAHLRTYSVKGLREIIAMGGKAMNGLVENINMIRRFQTNEGMTLMDTDDTFETHTYNFAGLDDIADKMAEQISGATQIPVTRLFGQAPAGLNATGEGDLKNYYDNVMRYQDRAMRPGLNLLLDILYRSTLGTEPPVGFGYEFNPLYQMSDTEKAEAASKNTASVVAAVGGGLVSQKIGLQELRKQGQVTGLWTTISDEDINDADDELPEPAPAETGANDETIGQPSGDDDE